MSVGYKSPRRISHLKPNQELQRRLSKLLKCSNEMIALPLVSEEDQLTENEIRRFKRVGGRYDITLEGSALRAEAYRWSQDNGERCNDVAATFAVGLAHIQPLIEREKENTPIFQRIENRRYIPLKCVGAKQELVSTSGWSSFCVVTKNEEGCFHQLYDDFSLDAEGPIFLEAPTLYENLPIKVSTKYDIESDLLFLDDYQGTPSDWDVLFKRISLKASFTIAKEHERALQNQYGHNIDVETLNPTFLFPSVGHFNLMLLKQLIPGAKIHTNIDAPKRCDELILPIFSRKVLQYSKRLKKTYPFHNYIERREFLRQLEKLGSIETHKIRAYLDQWIHRLKHQGRLWLTTDTMSIHHHEAAKYLREKGFVADTAFHSYWDKDDSTEDPMLFTYAPHPNDGSKCPPVLEPHFMSVWRKG